MGADDWTTVPIGTLCERIFDGPHATPMKTEEGPVFLGISALEQGRLNLSNVDHLSEEDYKTWTRRVIPQHEDIVFSYETRLGEAALIPKGFRGCLGRRMALMRVDRTKVDPRFLLYAYLGPEFQETIRTRTVRGSTVDRIPLIEFPDFPITVPPLEVQHGIAALLGALDDKIDLNRRMNVTLEGVARAIFQSWFVDFDPVRAKMEGRRPVGMDEATAALFPERFEESEIGEIPAGWRVNTIGEEVRVVGGSTPSTKESAFWDGGTIQWATPKDLSGISSPILLETEKKITEAGLQQISSGQLPEGTVLLSSRAPIGYLAIAEIPVAINQGFIAMVCEKEISSYYVLEWCRTNMEAIVGRANGTTFLEISKSNFRPIEVIVPSAVILQAYSKLVGPLYRKIGQNMAESRTLAALRDALLPELLSGAVRVG